eukprot:538556_1
MSFIGGRNINPVTQQEQEKPNTEETTDQTQTKTLSFSQINHPPTSPKRTELVQSKSTEVDPDKPKTNQITDQSVDIDSYTNTMSFKQRADILNKKKKMNKHNKRKESVTFKKLKEELKDVKEDTQAKNIINYIGGSDTNKLSLRQRALVSFQNNASNHQRWKRENDDWLAKQRAKQKGDDWLFKTQTKQSKTVPLKSQKGKGLSARIAMFNQNRMESETNWRTKLIERERKNSQARSPSTGNTAKNGSFVMEPIIVDTVSSPSEVVARLESVTPSTYERMTQKRDSTSYTLSPVPTGQTLKKHKRTTSSSQQAIIKRMMQQKDGWKSKYKKNEGDAILQKLMETLPTEEPKPKPQPKQAKQPAAENVQEEVESKENEDEWTKEHSPNTPQETDETNIHHMINHTIDGLFDIAHKERHENNTWKKRLQKEANPEDDHLALLNLQIRNVDSKMHIKRKGNRADRESFELALEERLSIRQTELLNIQSRFELEVANTKHTLRAENDSKSFEAMEEEKRNQMQQMMEQQVAERTSKMAHKEVVNRENGLKALRDLNVLVEEDTVMDMNHCHGMKDAIKYCIMDNPCLVSIQLTNAKLEDEWFVNDLLPVIAQHAKMLTELVVDCNPLEDASIKGLSRYVESNPPCLRVLQFKHLYGDITTAVMKEFVNALGKNTQLIKVVMDTRFNEQRDELQQILDRNWKRYAQERRLKKTLLTQISNRKAQEKEEKREKKEDTKDTKKEIKKDTKKNKKENKKTAKIDKKKETKKDNKKVVKTGSKKETKKETKKGIKKGTKKGTKKEIKKDNKKVVKTGSKKETKKETKKGIKKGTKKGTKKEIKKGTKKEIKKDNKKVVKTGSKKETKKETKKGIKKGTKKGTKKEIKKGTKKEIKKGTKKEIKKGTKKGTGTKKDKKANKKGKKDKKKKKNAKKTKANK